jgi:hypothetical protein
MGRMFDSTQVLKKNMYFKTSIFQKQVLLYIVLQDIVRLSKLIFPLHPAASLPIRLQQFKAIWLGKAALTRTISVPAYINICGPFLDLIRPAMRRVAFRTDRRKALTPRAPLGMSKHV